MPRARLAVARPRALDGHVRDQELGLRAPEIDAPPLGEPARVADVIRMEVRQHHARDRPAVELTREDPLPQRAHIVETDAGVHDGPAVAVGEQPQVDVVELKRQRHAQPHHAGGDFTHGAAGGRIGPRIVEGHAS